MKEPKDKRTKEYKVWKANFDKENSTGVGDLIEKATKATGIKKLVKFVAGEDCGCKERKEKANKLRVKHVWLRCFTEEHYNMWTKFKEKQKGNTITYDDQRNIIIPIYANLFAIALKPMNCCVKPYIDAIDKIYNTYQ